MILLDLAVMFLNALVRLVLELLSWFSIGGKP